MCKSVDISLVARQAKKLTITDVYFLSELSKLQADGTTAPHHWEILPARTKVAQRERHLLHQTSASDDELHDEGMEPFLKREETSRRFLDDDRPTDFTIHQLIQKFGSDAGLVFTDAAHLVL
ncbi:hypothetical protein GUITHDRAFT_109859 [Guillardia theta CCMP2712]|uniref:Uncharacterized protein n=1 Tax=Guillardia theta (strain CCMP2712) TaxID=905079 RepID=L1J7L3_GUITC|nr:hypothetical protein GUITHDRAFT_109859 [Guillardia theta CCMP2712]EKX44075.1 hypothetical protein GUITHDRAFT_109859 [Guillardia theta CCMP2712]|eukprot:XP_005831055.1 hypothetical protein GUITHDRAFT_109859 [Guillardia theta CCMP2712]